MRPAPDSTPIRASPLLLQFEDDCDIYNEVYADDGRSAERHEPVEPCMHLRGLSAPTAIEAVRAAMQCEHTQ